MNIYDEALKEVKSLDYLAEWYESDVVSVGYEKAKKNRETMTQNIIKALERAKKVEELLELYRKHMNTLCKNAREGVKDSLFSAEYVAYEVYQQIKALEEEMK